MRIWQSERNGPIVPLGQAIIKQDGHVLFEILSDLATRLIDFVKDMNKSFQSGLGMRFFHQFFDQFDRGENDPLAGAGHMREKAMFNRVVFGTVRRIMGDTNFDADFVGQVLEVDFEDLMPGTVTAAPVTEDQNGGGLRIEFAAISGPPVTKAITGELTGVVAGSDLDIAYIEVQIVQTMGNNDPGGLALEIVVIRLDFFQGIKTPGSIEIAQILLFLAIQTDNGVASGPIFGDQPGYVFKLFVTGWHLLHGPSSLRFSTAIVVLLEQLTHHPLADPNIMVCLQRFDDCSQGQVCPTHLFIHRVSGRMVSQHQQEFLINLGPLLLIGFATPSGFANTLLYFPLLQVTDFPGPFTNRAPTTGQDASNITPSALPKLQRFQTGVATTVFFRQTVVVSPHGLFYLTIIGLHEDNKDLFALQDVKYTGKFTARGTDFSTHLAALNHTRSEYQKKIRSIEDDYSLRWCETEQGNAVLEGYAIHFIPQGFELAVNQFCKHALNGTAPFRLLGFIREPRDSLVVAEVVDLHTGGGLSFEIYPDLISVYLPENTCGNSIARLYTNLQHFFSVQMTVEADNGDRIF